MAGMAEGVAASDGSISDTGIGDGRPPEPPADPVLAPKGWTWDRKSRDWVPRKRAAPGVSAGAEPGAGPVPPGDYEPGDDAPLGVTGLPGGDPDPGWMGEGQPTIKPFELDRETRNEIHALVALLYAVPAETLSLWDPYCFGPLEDDKTTRDVTKAVSDIVCASPRVAQWAVSAAGLRPWIKLAIALKPVAVAALHHHILRDVEVEVDRKKKEMIVDKRDWSQYPAA